MTDPNQPYGQPQGPQWYPPAQQPQYAYPPAQPLQPQQGYYPGMPSYQQPKKRKKWPWIVVGVVVTLIVVAAVASPTKKKDSTKTASGSPAVASTAPKIEHKLGSADASNDVTLGTITNETEIGFSHVDVSVTNHSSKRSNYLIELTLESADEKTQIDTATVVVDNLEPGQTSPQTGQFTKPAPPGSKVVIKSLDRLAA